MKRSATFIFLIAAMALLMTSYSSGPFYGGAGNRTGSAGSTAGCDGIVCHAANGGSASMNIALLQNGVPVTGYLPGSSYRIRLTLPVIATNRRNFGFQASIVKASDGVAQAGFLTDGGRSDLSVHQDVLVQLVEHNKYLPASPVGSGYVDTVSFGWQAPSAGFGTVRVYAVINSVDSNRSPVGDQPRAGTQDFTEIPTNVAVGNTPSQRALMLLPNPINTSTEALELRGLIPGQPLNLAIIDMQGRIVQRKSEQMAANGMLYLHIAPLPPGRFVLLVAQQGGMRSLPFEVK
jgi:hypothetical protein